MSDVWKSDPRKFCDVCRCWIKDNKSSIAFHENGKRHKEMLSKQLDSIRERATKQDIRQKKEAEWIKQMEEKALKDYRNKDLIGAGADLSSKRQIEEEASQIGPTPSGSGIGPQIPSSSGIGPQIPSGSVGPQIPSSLKAVKASTSGQKWHKSSDEAKKWFEAVTEEGQTYYWHVETHESAWTPPNEGYLSIKEQEDINRKHEARESKKVSLMYQSQAVHGTHKDDTEEVHQKSSTPYGAWKVIESKPVTFSSGVDLQTPEVRDKPTANVTLHKDLDHKVKHRATPTLNEGQGQIAFKKRKLNNDHRKNMRRKDEFDLYNN